MEIKEEESQLVKIYKYICYKRRRKIRLDDVVFMFIGSYEVLVDIKNFFQL